MLKKVRTRGAWLLLLLPIAVATLFALDALLTAVDVDAATGSDVVEPALEASTKPTLEVRDALISEPVQRRSVEGLLPGKPGAGAAPVGEEGEPAGPRPTPTLAPTVSAVAPDAGNAVPSEHGAPTGNSGPGGEEHSDDWGEDNDDGDDHERDEDD